MGSSDAKEIIHTANRSVNEMLESLKRIFPGKDLEELTMCVLRNSNVDEAINEILDSNLNENVESGMYMPQNRK